MVVGFHDGHPTLQIIEGNQTSMESPNLLEHLPESNPEQGIPWWGKLLMLVLSFSIIAGIAFTSRFVVSMSAALSSATGEDSQTVFDQIRQLIVPPERLLRGEAEDRINVLLLGMGGEGHAGAYLTDTIIVASYQPSTGRVGLLSLPRDLVVNIPGHGFRKINHANALGELDQSPESGTVLASRVVEQVIGAPLHYYVRVDFAGFVKVIDDLDGLDVVIERSFTDSAYPTLDFGYQTISFQAGLQHLTGEQVLQFVRSRHGTNSEGSDFARSKRQQKALLALKDRLFSLKTLLNPGAALAALETLGKHVEANLETWELLRMSRFGKSLTADSVITQVLEPGPTGLLVTETGLDGAYILVPRGGTFAEVHALFANLLSGQSQSTQATVEVLNGTTIPGLAARVANLLEGPNFTVIGVGNAEERNMTETIIYDVSGGTKSKLLAELKKRLDAEIATSLPRLFTARDAVSVSDLAPSLANNDVLERLLSQWTTSRVDFVVMVGSDQAEPTGTVGESPSL